MTESNRTASIERDTSETQIQLKLDLDGTGASKIETGIPFFEHMLTQISKHGMLDLEIVAQGDIEVDAHHTVEDVGIVFGQALAKAAGDKSGIFVTVTPMCLWMRRCPEWLSTCRDDQVSSTKLST